MTVALEIPWRRGQWLAEIRGTHTAFQCDSDPVRGEGVKGRGVLKFRLQPGWYVRIQRGVGILDLYAVDRVKARSLDQSLYDYCGVAPSGPLPGEPGAWYDERCRCDNPVSTYSVEGFPVCEGCCNDGRTQ